MLRLMTLTMLETLTVLEPTEFQSTETSLHMQHSRKLKQVTLGQPADSQKFLMVR